MPVGAGKSSVSVTVSRWASSIRVAKKRDAERGRVGILASNNMLVDQYLKDYPTLQCLHASHRYTCNTTGISIKERQVKKMGLCHPQMGCPGCTKYKNDSRRIWSAPYALLNYHMYFALKFFKHFNCLVVDECFPGDTRVITSDGYKSIQEIARTYKTVDIKVKAWNEASRVFEYKKVTHAWERPTTKDLIVVHTGNTKFTATENHRFLTDIGYTSAKDIQIGDYLVGDRTSNKARIRYIGHSLQVVLGSILGDGHWATAGSTVVDKRLTIRHGLKQLDYLKFKAELLGTEVKANGVSGYTGEVQYITQTSTIYSKYHNTKVAALSLLDLRGLAIWFADDGSTSINNRSNSVTARLHTESWKVEEIEEAILVLQSRFGVKGILRRYKDDKYPYISFNVEETKTLLRSIAPYLPSCMDYKLKGIGITGKIDWVKEVDTAGYLPVTKVENKGKTDKPVYDLEVEDLHNFSIKTKSSVTKTEVIVHNCHNLINLLQDLGSSRIFQHTLPKEYRYPDRLNSVQQLRDWLDSLPDELLEESSALQHFKQAAYSNKYIFREGEEEYRGELRHCLKLLPIDLTEEPQIFFPSRMNKIVLLSATISSKDIEQMGLYRRKVSYFSATSPIPAENRPVYCVTPGLNMSYRHQDKNLPELAEMVLELAKLYPGEKGLIHTPYSLAWKLRAALKGREPRLLFHDKENKMEVYKKFRTSEEPYILVASGMYEGIDLPYEAARFQAVTKVPYPSLADPAIAFKAERDRGWYAWSTIKTILQACGRVVRATDDYGSTYILDNSFNRLYKDNIDVGYFPVWFQDSVQEVPYD